MKPSSSSLLRGLIAVGLVLLAGFLFLATPGRTQAAACVFNPTGGDFSWSNSDSWQDCGDGLPQPGDTVTAGKVTVDVDVTIAGLDASMVTLGDSAPVTLTVTGNASFSSDVSQGAPGSALVVGGNLTFTDATVNGLSMIRVGGDWINNGIFDPGTGTVEFNGSGPQTLYTNPVADPFFYNLTINNTGGTAGVSLSGQSIVVNHTLTFTNGRLTLGDFDLTMGSAAGQVVGTQAPTADDGGVVEPDASKMVVADSIGQMCRYFAQDFIQDTYYIFPVGDAVDDVYRYSPVVLAYNSGAADTICLNLRYARHPFLPASFENYLNRYWTVTRSGTGAFQYSAVFHYPQADVVGTESLLMGMRYGLDGLVNKWHRYPSSHNETSNTVIFIGLSALSDFTAADKTPTAAGFEYFRAAKVSGGVRLAWQTTFETGVSGFNLYRRVRGQADFVRLNGAAIPALGPDGGAYTYLDAAAQAGKVYEYKVVESNTYLHASGAAYTTYYPHVIFLSLLRR